MRRRWNINLMNNPFLVHQFEQRNPIKHRDAERKRRMDMSQRFEELLILIPKEYFSRTRPGRKEVLYAAIKYIKDLKK